MRVGLYLSSDDTSPLSSFRRHAGPGKKGPSRIIERTTSSRPESRTIAKVLPLVPKNRLKLHLNTENKDIATLI